jgi:biopolymer transport protein ExbD
MDQINVIPFIDIMLVLLAIVLTTATFIVEGRLEIKLPEAQSEAPAQLLDPIEIAVDADGGLFVDTQPLGTGPEAVASLAPRLEGLDPATPVSLRVDARARFEHFIAVIDLLKVRELERVTVITRQP